MNKYLKTESIIPTFKISEKQILNNIYKIHNWIDTLNYFRNYKKNDLKYGSGRILSYSWIVFLNSYKDNLNIILEIYKIYIKIEEKLSDKGYNEKKLKEKIRNLDIKKYKIDENFFIRILE